MGWEFVKAPTATDTGIDHWRVDAVVRFANGITETFVFQNVPKQRTEWEFAPDDRGTVRGVNGDWISRWVEEPAGWRERTTDEAVRIVNPTDVSAYVNERLAWHEARMARGVP